MRLLTAFPFSGPVMAFNFFRQQADGAATAIKADITTTPLPVSTEIPTFLPPPEPPMFQVVDFSHGQLLQKQQELSTLFVTDEPEWQGHGAWIIIPQDTCVPLNSTDQPGLQYFDERISAFGPDPDNSCIIYENDNCIDEDGFEVQVDFPGLANLTTLGYDKSIRSIKCWRK